MQTMSDVFKLLVIDPATGKQGTLDQDSPKALALGESLKAFHAEVQADPNAQILAGGQLALTSLAFPELRKVHPRVLQRLMMTAMAVGVTVGVYMERNTE